MFSVNTDAEGWQTVLKNLFPEKYQQATAEALNALAKQANVMQAENIKASYTLRNKFTLGSLKIYTANPSKSIQDQNAVIGSTSPYMAIHDTGGEFKPAQRAIPLPTLASRGNNPAKPVRASLRLSKLKGQTFALYPTSGGKLKTPALFYRNGKKLVKLRYLMDSITVGGTHWHENAVKKYCTPDKLAAVFKKKVEALFSKKN